MVTALEQRLFRGGGWGQMDEYLGSKHSTSADDVEGPKCQTSELLGAAMASPLSPAPLTTSDPLLVAPNHPNPPAQIQGGGWGGSGGGGGNQGGDK